MYKSCFRVLVYKWCVDVVPWMLEQLPMQWFVSRREYISNLSQSSKHKDIFICSWTLKDWMDQLLLKKYISARDNVYFQPSRFENIKSLQDDVYIFFSDPQSLQPHYGLHTLQRFPSHWVSSKDADAHLWKLADFCGKLPCGWFIFWNYCFASISSHSFYADLDV